MKALCFRYISQPICPLSSTTKPIWTVRKTHSFNFVPPLIYKSTDSIFLLFKSSIPVFNFIFFATKPFFFQSSSSKTHDERLRASPMKLFNF